MGRKTKVKEIKLKANEVKAVITRDYKILLVDEKTNGLIPEAKDATQLDGDALDYLLDKGMELTGEGGKYYKLTQRLLEQYCFFTMSYDKGMKLADEIKADRERLNQKFEPKAYMVYDEHDLYNVSAFFLQERSATKKMMHYFNSEDNFERAAAAARLIESGVEALAASGVEDWKIEADILTCRYMTPENKQLKEQEIMDFLGIKRNRYFNLKADGISNLARYLFGSFPHERGYVRDEDLEFLNRKPAKKNKSRKINEEDTEPEIVEV